ncbi:MAG: hypothetical protein KDE54_15925, partial [Caldilineaceae bacterium]|nr:hypothetical protein [Caldilineaceae bacterium]
MGQRSIPFDGSMGSHAASSRKGRDQLINSLGSQRALLINKEMIMQVRSMFITVIASAMLLTA